MVGRRTKFLDSTDGRMKGSRGYKEIHTSITFLGKIIKPFYLIFIKMPFYILKYWFITIKFLTKYLFLGVRFIFKKIPIAINYLLSKFRNRNINNNQKKQ